MWTPLQHRLRLTSCGVVVLACAFALSNGGFSRRTLDIADLKTETVMVDPTQAILNVINGTMYMQGTSGLISQLLNRTWKPGLWLEDVQKKQTFWRRYFTCEAIQSLLQTSGYKKMPYHMGNQGAYDFSVVNNGTVVGFPGHLAIYFGGTWFDGTMDVDCTFIDVPGPWKPARCMSNFGPTYLYPYSD